MNYLDKEQILDIHKKLTDVVGDNDAVNDDMRLNEIIEKARSTNDIWEAAIQYLKICQQPQCFKDGNRRSSFAITAIFLRMNGLRLKVKHNIIPDFMTSIKNNEVLDEHMIDFLRSNSRPKLPKTFEDSFKWFLNKYGDILEGMSALND